MSDEPSTNSVDRSAFSIAKLGDSTDELQYGYMGCRASDRYKDLDDLDNLP